MVTSGADHRQGNVQASNHCPHFAGRLWPAEEVALNFRAALPPQLLELLGGLNPLGDRGDAKIFTEADNGANDNRAAFGSG